MNHHKFAENPLRRAVASAHSSGKKFTKPIGHIAAILTASTIGLTSGTTMAAEGAVLEEIIVTATRREASLQDVAIPMTAVSGEALERAFAQDLRDLTNAAPNVQLEPVGIFQNSASFFIRGQGTGDIESAADSKVGVYVDGVPQGRVSTALSDMLDVSSVEILRGPQGTLFGRNTIAGAVQLLHNAPQMNEWGTQLSVQAGDFGRLDAKGIVNVPMIDDTLAGRIALKSTNHDGYWKNSAVDKDRGAVDRLTINPSLKWTPNDQLNITLRGEWSKTRDDTNMTQAHHYCRQDPFLNVFGGPAARPGSNDLVITAATLYNLIVLGQNPVSAAADAAQLCGKPLGSTSVDDEFTALNTEDRGQQYNTDVWGVTWQADYELGEAGTITYIGNYRKTEEDIIFTIDASDIDLFAGRRIQDHDQMSHELRFASNFSDTFDFVAGGLYFQQEYAMKQESWGMLFHPNVIFRDAIVGPINFVHPATQGQAGFSNQENEAWALFATANWHATEALTLTVGGRYTSETKDFTHCAVGTGDPSQSPGAAKNTRGCNNVPAFRADFTRPPFRPNATGPAATPIFQQIPAIGFDDSRGAQAGCRPRLDPTGSAIVCNNRLEPDEEKWSDFTPMAGITYQFNDDVMAYFTWSEGFTAGGFNGRGGSATTVGPFNPEKARNFELGVKSDWFDNRLRVNATAFDTKVEDFQTAFIRAAPGGGGQETIQSNLGSFETQGVEFEISGLPTDGLTVWLNVSYLKTKRVGFCTDPDGASGTDPLTPPSVGGPFSAGAPLCGTPERITNAVGVFQGWLVPVDVSEVSRGGRAPEWTTTAGVAYDFNLNDMGNVTISADWFWSAKSGIGGSRFNEPDGVQQFNGDFLKHEREEYNIVNASIVWRSQGGRYEIAAFGKNLTNELYNQATTVVGGLLNFRNTNIRRHYAAEFRVNLGTI